MDNIKYFLTTNANNAIDITVIPTTQFDTFQEQLTETEKNWIKINNFKAKPESILILPDDNGNIAQVLYIINQRSDFLQFANLKNNYL